MEVNGQLHASPDLPKERKALVPTQQDAERTTEPIEKVWQEASGDE